MEEKKLKKLTLKDKLIDVAEIIDAWRIVPRAFLVVYGLLVIQLYTWFINIPTHVQTKCDAAVMKFLSENGVGLKEAQELSCYVVDTVGGATAAQTAFVTTIIGLSSAIFGFYASTGRKWEKGGRDNGYIQPIINYPPYPTPSPPNYRKHPYHNDANAPPQDNEVKFEP
jgi:hypothetical protein